MSDELKYHYSNPKFDGLPWPAESTKNVKPIKKKKCVKKPYTESEAQEEAASLRKEFPSFLWATRFCENCNVYHVWRD